jgi:hypothetical protein
MVSPPQERALQRLISSPLFVRRVPVRTDDGAVDHEIPVVLAAGCSVETLPCPWGSSGGGGDGKPAMRTMTQSALQVARKALNAGEAVLPAYGGRFSRRDYTQPQLFALLVLRQFLRTD